MTESNDSLETKNEHFDNFWLKHNLAISFASITLGALAPCTSDLSRQYSLPQTRFGARDVDSSGPLIRISSPSIRSSTIEGPSVVFPNARGGSTWPVGKGKMTTNKRHNM